LPSQAEEAVRIERELRRIAAQAKSKDAQDRAQREAQKQLAQQSAQRAREKAEADAKRRREEQEVLQAQQAQREAEAQERAEAEAKRQQEQRAAQQAQQARQEAEERKPNNVLATAFQNYAMVKKCYDARQGYLSVFISDAELARARKAARRLEEKLAPQLPPEHSSEQLWANAASQAPAEWQLRDANGLCKTALARLEAAYSQHVPEDTRMGKDF